MPQPYYMIDFSAACCMFEIRINDIPVMMLDLPGQAASMTPVNFSILESGTQIITATVFPHSGNLVLDPEAKLKFDIKLFDVERGFAFKEQLVKYEFEKVDPHKKLPVLRHQTSFSAQVPYSLEGWKNGIALKDVKDVNIKLSNAYERVSSLISRRDYTGFRTSIANRENIMNRSMYLDLAKAKDRIDNLIEDFEGGFKVATIPPDAVLQIYGNGKVAALKKINGESAFFLVNNETREELMIDIMFYISTGKTEFEVI
ncbi:hypothetical protein [Pedobacter sp. L105]|uniref:hypothetical protein n=1 Tax=Pedobacter sp. L105 TaxID=1641871 RepID=UPI00131B031C|nr:hypothetical protein [Pedobacter sp. L105]